MAKVIADFGLNHRGSLETLREMVRAAAEAGADYAEIHSMRADDLVYRERFEEGRVEKGQVSAIKRPYREEYQRLKQFNLGDEAYGAFIDECRAAGLKPLAAVYTRSRIPFLASLPWREVRVLGYDCGSYPMIRELSERFDHLFISTEAAADEEVERTARMLKGRSFTLLHSVALYPAPLERMNLDRMGYLRRFTGSVGFSDHCSVEGDGLKAAIAALYLGAEVIEKPFTILERGLTPDGTMAVDPVQLKELVGYARMGKEELGDLVARMPEFKVMKGVKHPELSPEERLNRDYYRGRFASRVKGLVVFNWEEKKVF
ncbi:MAG: N-acetylneuraminate synthase family protein [Candidatus Hadarchaeum sp.]|uniref:N-acetylneuraminate synthase family protein n=1 Tax=Candidatus Hadarchaeum sp. TaxID=2883567 RepID=UPI003D140C96